MSKPMNVLIVCSGTTGSIAPFVREQAIFIKKKGINIAFHLINSKGLFGYLQQVPRLYVTLKKSRFDLIHAHYGLSGMLSVLQNKVPVITTFHGCDIGYNKPWNVIGYCGSCNACSKITILHNKLISKAASKLSAFNIIVEKSQAQNLSLTNNYKVIPCGVDLDTFYEIPRHKARQKMGIPIQDKVILFSGAISDLRKNYVLAKKAVDLIGNIRLLELINYSRTELNLLMNAANAQIVTSLNETGPLVVKEAMACNTPIVTTDVGDVREVMGNTDGCYITGYDPQDVAEKLERAINFDKRTKGRLHIKYLDNNLIAGEVISVYKKVLGGN
jgi:teichuronic acid biosynthesis glycosyltransferase TuaC